MHDDIIQIRSVNPATKRAMKHEALEEGITISALLDKMWAGYTTCKNVERELQARKEAVTAA